MALVEKPHPGRRGRDEVRRASGPALSLLGRFNAIHDEWVRSLDEGLRTSTISVGAIGAAFVLALGGMSAVTFAPQAAEFFRFRFALGVFLYLPQLLLSLVLLWAQERRKISLRAFGIFSLNGAFLFQVWNWSLVPLSMGDAGAAVMAAFPILLTSFHGYLYNASFRHPFSTVISVFALGVAFLFAQTPAHFVILSIAGPIAIFNHLLLGHFAKASAHTRRHREALRAAVDAQILQERARELRQVGGMLTELRGRNHDAGNAVAGPLLNIPYFLELLQSPDSNEKREELIQLGQAIENSLERLRDLLTQSKETASGAGVAAPLILPFQIIEEAVAEVAALHPGTKLRILCETSTRKMTIPFHGGESALSRVITNLALNAVQGNGLHRGREVIVEMRGNSLGVHITVEDDGPGFSPEALESSLSDLTTTKADGSGLGLYTASRVLAASGGTLQRKNRVDAVGAQVTIVLRRQGDEL